MTCEDCVHYGICIFHLTNEEYKKCVHFKPKSRYIELPCAVGDTMYQICHVSDAIPDFIVSDTITKIGLTTKGILHEQSYDFNQIGKTVFLSREEAEKALKEKQR